MAKVKKCSPTVHGMRDFSQMESDPEQAFSYSPMDSGMKGNGWITTCMALEGRLIRTAPVYEGAFKNNIPTGEGNIASKP